MVRWVVAALFVLHGLVHLLGFVVPWQLATVAGFPYRTERRRTFVHIGLM